MGRAPCCDKANVKKGPWSPEEDAKLKSYIEQHGTGGNWIALPQKIGLKRCGKSCRLRWLNYLRPNIKHGGFSEEEDNIICSLYITIGSRWSIIAAQLPGRTDNDIKNYWNTRLKKKLLGKQQARRPLKKEASIAGEGGSMSLDGGGGSGTIYWPEQQQHVNTFQVNPGEHRANNDDYEAIRRLLVKLGGRFSSNTEATLIQNTPPPPPPPPSLGEGCSTMTAPMIGNPNGFPAELDEWLHGSSVRLEGLDCFYEAESSAGGGGSSLAGTSINWSEVSPLVYPTLDASYQGMQQCLLEDQMQLGTQ